MLSAQLASLLQSAARARGARTRFEVLNLGVPGYNIEQVVENTRVRGLPFEPDAIVYAYCLNDPQAYSFELESLKQQLSPAGLAYRAARAARSPRSLERSRLVLLRAYALRSQGARPAAVNRTRSGRRCAAATTRAISSSCTATRTAVRACSAASTRSQRLASSANAPLVGRGSFRCSPICEAYRLEALHRDVGARLRARGIATHDLLPMYAAAQRAFGPVFVFNALHPNAIGDRIAALYLAARDGSRGSARRGDA